MDIHPLFFLIAATVIIVIWIAHSFDKKRRRAFITIARSRGLSYSRDANLDADPKLTDFYLFT
jgi:hypothetical protein